MNIKIYCNNSVQSKKSVDLTNMLYIYTMELAKDTGYKISFIDLKTNDRFIDKNSTLIYILPNNFDGRYNSEEGVTYIANEFQKFILQNPRFYSIFMVGNLEQSYFNMLRHIIYTMCGIVGFRFYNSISYNTSFMELLINDCFDNGLKILNKCTNK